MSAPREGEVAPDLALPDQDGRLVRLSALRGRTVVLFFYPEDDSPTCTEVACGFRDLAKDFSKAGALVFGVSAQGADSHRRFRAKRRLPYPLLVDEGNTVAARWGAWGKKVLYGRTVNGTIRSTFIVGPDGRIARAMRNIRAKGHAARTLAALAAMP